MRTYVLSYQDMIWKSRHRICAKYKDKVSTNYWEVKIKFCKPIAKVEICAYINRNSDFM